MRRVPALVGLLLAASGVVPAAQAPPATPTVTPFSVAVVRADGRVVPVGTFDGASWSPLASAAGAWHVWLLDDPEVKASPFAVRAPRPVTADGRGRCASANRLPTAAATEPAAPIGVATSVPAVRVDLLTPLAADTDLGRWIVTRATAPFHRAEEDSLSVAQDELPRNFPAFAARQTRPIEWTRIVRHGLAQAATRTYYLEGRKDYDGFTGRIDVGRIRTTGHVFVQVAGGRETADAEVDLSDVDGKQSIFRTPLVVVRAGEVAYWLFAVRSFGAELYELMEVSGPSRRPLGVVQVPAGC